MLAPREEKALTLRFGGDPRTLEEIGKEFKISRECIRQIEAKALRKTEGRALALDSLSRKHLRDEMKITEYDVHVHEIRGNRLGKEIVGRYFYITNVDEEPLNTR